MPRFHIAASAVALLVLAACGGDSVSPGNTNPPPPPPPPAAVASIELTPATASVAIAKTTALSATLRDAAGNALTGRTLAWSSSAGAVATVDNNGVVTGVAPGTATISATAENKTATAAITVLAPAPVVPVASVTISAAGLDTLEAYDAKTLAAITRDAKDSLLIGRVVRWSSSNPAIAAIDSVTGALMGYDRGTVTITATSEGKTGTVSRVIVIKYRSVVAGSMHACDIASGGFVWCWGLNGREGRIGGATMGDNAMSTAPVLVPNTGWTALRFAQLNAYGNHTCGITVDAKAYCWGSNSWYQLGNGNGLPSFQPALVSSSISFKQVSAGADHSCGVATDNRAYCWGHNDWRQFGTTTVPSSSTPVAIAPEISFASISAASAYTCGVSTTGVGYCFGASGHGELGDGTKISYGNTFSTAPVTVATASSLRTIEAGLGYACALTTNNQALCWGSNGGKLGNGSAGVDTSVPVAVSGGLSFNSITTGNGFSCGVTTNSELYCWGSNDNGQLGVVGINFSTTPVRAGGSLRAAEVATSGIATGYGRHSCVITADRLSAYCFGRNETGQLGNGNTTTATAVNASPTLVVGQKPLP
jgi:hypothetical protein